MEELEKYMKALVLLQIDAAREDGDRGVPDVLLRGAGLTTAEISKLLNKRPDTVKHALSRAKKAKTKRKVKK